MQNQENFQKMNAMIKSIFGIDSYYNARTFRMLDLNVYYQSIFQLHFDSLQILLQSEDQELAALYQPHFESFLGYLNIYKEYDHNSPESHKEQKIEEKWIRKDFINLMKEFFSTEKPEFIIHFLGQTTLGEIPDIKTSSWKFGKFPANYNDRTKISSMFIHLSKLVDYWEEFQKFHKMLRQKYPEGISKQGTHKIPKKKDIRKLILLNPYIPDLWLDLARSSKKEKDVLIYLRAALCLDQYRYDIWKELIRFDPNFSKTNIPKLDDEINAIINNKIYQAEKKHESDEQQKMAKGIVQKAKTLKQRHNAFNNMSQLMRRNETKAPSQPIESTSTNLPSYFEYLRGVPTINHKELYKKIEGAISTLTNKDRRTVQSLEMVAQKAFETGELEKAVELFLTIVHLSAQIGAIKQQIQATNNLGIFFSNVRRYDIARKYANEAKQLATQNNLLEEKLEALKVFGLILANDNKNPRNRIAIMEETVEILEKLGREEEKKQTLEQLKAVKEFLELLGK